MEDKSSVESMRILHERDDTLMLSTALLKKGSIENIFLCHKVAQISSLSMVLS